MQVLKSLSGQSLFLGQEKHWDGCTRALLSANLTSSCCRHSPTLSPTRACLSEPSHPPFQLRCLRPGTRPQNHPYVAGESRVKPSCPEPTALTTCLYYPFIEFPSFSIRPHMDCTIRPLLLFYPVLRGFLATQPVPNIFLKNCHLKPAQKTISLTAETADLTILTVIVAGKDPTNRRNPANLRSSRLDVAADPT